MRKAKQTKSYSCNLTTCKNKLKALRLQLEACSLKLLQLTFLATIIAITTGFSTHNWQKSTSGIYEPDIQTIQIDPNNNSIIFAGTSKGLYRSLNKGSDFRPIFRGQSNDSAVNSIYISKENSNKILVATNSGLYERKNDSDVFKRIFYSTDSDERKSHDVISDDNTIYLATGAGLFIKYPVSSNFQKYSNTLDGDAVYLLESCKEYVYLATDQDVYRLDKVSREITKIFHVGVSATENGDYTSEGEYQASRHIKSVNIYNTSQPLLLIATTKGIYYTDTQNLRWHKIPHDNIPLDKVSSIVMLNENINIIGHGNQGADYQKKINLLVGTKRGAFSLIHGSWAPMYKGMETNNIKCLVKDNASTVYAATDKGLFYLTIEQELPSFLKSQVGVDGVHPENPMGIPAFAGMTGSARMTASTVIPGEDPGSQKEVISAGEIRQNMNEIFTKFADEPTIDQVHALAIDYAEVHNDKIKQWRKLAKRKAWLPSLSMGLDQSKNKTVSDSVYGSYSGSHYLAPDDKTFYDNMGWDVSLSWDFSDLIWSSDQTSIDSRSKMMVELREDVLDQVTRLYFERRRLQAEVEMIAMSDTQMMFDKHLRIQELTALIDAFTGGSFSSLIKESRNNDNKNTKH